jgi:hypothetical protein
MDRSPGFGSTATHYFALFRLGFPAAPGLYPLTSRVTVTRRLILQQARYHPLNRALTACKHTDSRSISLPSRGSFHLSLAVLVHYRSPRVLSLMRWSSLIQTGFHVARPTRGTHSLASPTTTGLSPALVRLPRRFISATQYDEG